MIILILFLLAFYLIFVIHSIVNRSLRNFHLGNLIVLPFFGLILLFVFTFDASRPSESLLKGRAYSEVSEWEKLLYGLQTNPMVVLLIIISLLLISYSCVKMISSTLKKN